MAHCPVATTAVRVGECLASSEWSDLRQRAIFDCGKWDVQCEDHSVLANFPLLMDSDTAKFLNDKAEALAREAFAAERELVQRPDLLGRLGLPRTIQRVLARDTDSGSCDTELRVMRFDFHLTPVGWRISEVNADVPGGFIEAGAWNSLLAEKYSGVGALGNPAETYAGAISDVAGKSGLVALVHATAYSDDRQVMMYLARTFAARRVRTVLCSPAHLRWRSGRAEFCASFACGRPDVIVRFFPAEWLTNLPGAGLWKSYFKRSETPQSNPGRAIVLQSKRFPLVWEELRTDVSTWHELLPETRCFSEIGGTPDDCWVVKPALGRVGEGVGIAGITARDEFETILRIARKQPKGWIGQKRFEIVEVEGPARLRFPCIGVFTIGEKACGFYGRISENPVIDRDARDAAVLVSDEVYGSES